MSAYLSLKELADELDDLRGRSESEDSDDALDDDEKERLAALVCLETDLGDLQSAARDEDTLIPEDEFVDYAKQLAEDIGDMRKAEGWPFRHIDWDAAADELKQDYTECDFAGETYLYRQS